MITLQSSGKDSRTRRNRNVPLILSFKTGARWRNENVAKILPRRPSLFLLLIAFGQLSFRSNAWTLTSTAITGSYSSIRGGNDRIFAQCGTRTMSTPRSNPSSSHDGVSMFCMSASGEDGINSVAKAGINEKDDEQEAGGGPLWLGLDLSTQSLTGAVLRGNGVGGTSNDPVILESINFERDLPVEHRYGTKNGMTVTGSQVTSPVAMWLHALEALLQRFIDPTGEMASVGLDLSEVRAVSVSGQQHGTVYWAKGAEKKLQAMSSAKGEISNGSLPASGTASEAGKTAETVGSRTDSSSGGGSHMKVERRYDGGGRGEEGEGGTMEAGSTAVAAKVQTAPSETVAGLAEAFSGCFSVEDSPIWADGSTAEYAADLEERMGGAARLAELTGSRAHLRQGAPQIMKIYQERPAAYENTERISLVCSFLASVLAGRYAEIETSDGSGMNLMHIREKRWVEEALEATAPGLIDRLGGDVGIVDSHEGVGNVSGYLCQRFGFSRDCLVIAGSGDNCNSLAGMGVVSAGGSTTESSEIEVEAGSSGGSDVMISLGTSDTLLGVTGDPSPTTTGNTMYHPCDPSLWFAMLVYKNGSLTRERVRDRRAGGSWDTFSRLLSDGKAGNGGKLGLFLDLYEITPQINRQGNYVVDADDRETAQEKMSAEEETRAVVEGRFLSMRAHARELGVGQPSRILATGGGSNNVEVLQVLADVFQAAVFTAAASDSAAIGAALRAKHGMECRRRGNSYVPFVEVFGTSTLGAPSAVPTTGVQDKYTLMVERMDKLEQKVMTMSKVEPERKAS